MSVVFTRESEDLLVVDIKGTFTFEDLKEVQDKGHGEIDRSGKVKILVLAEEFSGWGKEGDWGDLTFMYEHDADIEKIAVIAAEEWMDQILMFLGDGRRKALVRSFQPDKQKDARDWLQLASE